MRTSLSLSIIGLLIFGLPAFAAGKKRPSDEERGQELYDRHCLSCHGAKAAGNGPLASSMVTPIPSLEGKYSMDDVNRLVPVVLVGQGRMPGFEATFDRYDARRVLRHLVRISQPSPKPEEPTP